jgi:hypothetical protein
MCNVQTNVIPVILVPTGYISKSLKIIPDKLYLESSAVNSRVNTQNTFQTRTVYCDHNIGATLCILDTRIVSSLEV